MDQAARGAAALEASNFAEAIKQYTSAISTNSGAPNYYIQRSIAYHKSQKYPEALADAETALVLAHERSKRELIAKAQLRRGITLICVERYADAEFVLNIAKRLNEKEPTLPSYFKRVAEKLAPLKESGDAERLKVTVKEIPDVKAPSPSNSKSGENNVVEAPTPRPVVPTPANKIKHDWYQNNENVYFTLLAKGVPKDKTTVEIDKDSLSISFPIQDSADFNYSLDPFYAPVDPSLSTFKITPTKVEVTLKKATPGVKWHNLEGDRKTSTPAEEKTSIPSHVLVPKTIEQAPAYPTSSKKGAKDWDKVAKDDADGDADDFDGDETTRFFKQLYKGADPDQQRAMMKSYQESGGTVLSTDWSNVGKKTVTPEPPDGMEAKKY